jgi:hypothetical protein
MAMKMISATQSLTTMMKTYPRQTETPRKRILARRSPRELTGKCLPAKTGMADTPESIWGR